MSKRNVARSVADVDSGTILAAIEIAITPERVFQALTAPSEIVRWWGSDEVYRTTGWQSDLRVGGKWRADGKGADGEPFYVEGEFLEIDPPRKLVQTWKPQWDGGEVTKLTYLLEATDTGTRVIVRHEGFGKNASSCRSHAEGWAMVLGWLAQHAQPAAAESFFLCRLVAPRPTFAFDMSDDERALMQKHAAYLGGLLGEGKLVVFGPVADPQGPWGLAIARAANADAVQAFLSQDPAILSGRGFRYDTLPMLTAVL